MDKNLIWKSLLIVVIIALAAWNLYPPQETLKPGIDLAGGTSLIYEIDTTDLAPGEQRNLAQNMIPILLKRINPTHVANIVMRPQGDTRIEIQLPVASMDTQKKRAAYEAALSALEEENINLLKIRQALTLPAEQRQPALEQYAKGNDSRGQILTDLANIYDLRKQAQQQRDQLVAEMDGVKAKFEAAGLNVETLQYNFRTWTKEEPAKQKESVETYIKTNVKEDAAADGSLGARQTQAVALISDYLKLYGRWFPVVDDLTKPETGLNDRWDAAVKNMGQLNLSIDLFQNVLEMPKDSKPRNEKLESWKKAFPERSGKIDAVVTAFDTYRVVGGRLDDPEDLKRMLKGSGVLEFRILPTGEEGNATELEAYREALTSKGPKLASDSRHVWCLIEDPAAWNGGGVTGTFGEKIYVLCSNQPNEKMLHGGDKKWKLKKAYPTSDEQGRRAIGFTFDDVAANRFFAITSNNIGKPLAILLDDQVISAPRINSAIRSSGIITGSFSQVEVADMVNKLNAGSFPARLSEVPISEKSISATIGKDNRDKGIKAGLIGLAGTMLFMLVYYFLAGAIANVALLLNVLLILGVMSLLDATFTLPGIAGFLLSIGMSVDANVLINERIREEQQRGSSVKTAIANGYHRAFTTIFDSNLTTFLPALVLYMAASEEVKGFAIVVIIGQVANLATALFVTRVIFDWLTSTRLLTNRLRMFALMRNPHINWMGLRPIFLTISSILVIGGLAVFFTRNETKSSKYDIEFIGGTSIEIELKEGTGYNREKVEQIFTSYARSIGNSALTAAKIYEVGQSGRQFEISTTETNKTTAAVALNPGTAETAATLAEKIRQAAAKTGKTLPNLNITAAGSNVYTVSTGRLNADTVNEVLTDALGASGTVSNVEVQEIVSNAVHEAFKEFLTVRKDIGLTVVKEQKIEEDSEDVSLLADYQGGVRLICDLQTETTATEIEARISTLLSKPDMQDLARYPHKLLKPDLSEPAADELLNQFVYVSVHPDAGYRELEQNEWQNFVDNEKTKLAGAASLATSLSRVTQIDPSIGAQSKQRAIVASILSLIAILGYIWVRFGTARYGFAAIIALMHNVIITLGLFTACTYLAPTAIGKALLLGDFKINLEIIAAFLTLIGYSVNDTIVVFDRIRENRGKLGILTPDTISASINQTLSRTILTGTTTLMVLVVMYIWGGPGLRDFTFVMLVGILVGTYSSIAIASPILLIGKSQVDQITK
ncbi:MAG: protein translocase subunit SecD [Planctomycetales bacterium]|nr:protein translocase subunit SecD [Planctomycetales bacterium]